MNITTKIGRDRLPERQEPYWHPLTRGCALGFRQKAGGSWIVRYRDRSSKKHYRALGSFADFSAARSAADEWLKRIAAGTRRAPARGTVRDALAAYLRHLRSIGRGRTAWEAGQRFRLTVARASVFGAMRLEDVTREDVEAWRTRLRKGRAPRSVNRQVRAVVAALNFAVEHRGHIGNPRAWRLTHLVDDDEANTPVFLSTVQRDRLIAAAPKSLSALLTGYSHTGARPSELAQAIVADFDAKGGTVTLRHHKGRGAKLRSRAVLLSDDGAEFFRAITRGKSPKSPLFANEDGTHWTDQQWCGGITRAVVAANKTATTPAQRIPDGATAYSFRHTRISELLQVFKIDPLTTAQQTGTSVAMIEKYYFKFISSSMREKLNAVRQA